MECTTAVQGFARKGRQCLAKWFHYALVMRLLATKVPVLYPAIKCLLSVRVSMFVVQAQDEKTQALGEAPNRLRFLFNQLHGAGSQVERCTTTHTKDARVTSNRKDRGCSRGDGMVTVAGQLSRNTGEWTQEPLVRLFEP